MEVNKDFNQYRAKIQDSDWLILKCELEVSCIIIKCLVIRG